MKESKLLNCFSEEVKKEILETLKGWSGCYVDIHEKTSEIRVVTSCSITKGNDPWRCIASFENTDVYSNEEIEKYSKEYWKGAQWF